MSDVRVANYKVKLNGTEFSPELKSAIESITIEDEINLPTMFCIQINMVDSDKGKWRGIDLKTLKPGDKVAISIGIDKVENIVSGEITSLCANLGKHSVLEIRGYDFLHKLRMGTRNKVFTKKKYSDIASEIAKEHGLTPNIDDSKTVYPYIFQNNQSNYEFLLKKAEYLNYDMYVEDKKFFFVKSRISKSPEIDMNYRKEFEELNLELKVLSRGSEVVVRGWDVKEKKEIESTAKKGDESTKMGGKESGFELSTKAVEASPVAVWVENLVDMNEAKSAAIAQYNNLLDEFITGEGKCWGDSRLRAGKSVKLLGIDERFSGTYYIVSTIHNIDKSGYTTIFKVKRTGI